jgi:hypothetical protein
MGYFALVEIGGIILYVIISSIFAAIGLAVLAAGGGFPGF